MYILFVMLLSGLATGDELEIGSYPTINECWIQADKFAVNPEVFSVRCVRKDTQ